MSSACLQHSSVHSAWRSAPSGHAQPSRARAPVPRSPFQAAEVGAAHHEPSVPSSFLSRADSLRENAVRCVRNNSCKATALSAALSVALSLEATPSKVIESTVDFISDLLVDVLPMSQMLGGKAAAATMGGGAMHMLNQQCDASCLGTKFTDGVHAFAPQLQSVAEGLNGLADDAIAGQLLKVVAAAGVAFTVRRALKPMAPLAPCLAAVTARSQQQEAAALTPMAMAITLGMLAASETSPDTAKMLMLAQQEQPQVEEPLSPRRAAAAVKAASFSAIKDATSWPTKLKRRVRKAAAEVNQGKLSLVGVLVALDVAALAHTAGDVAQVVQQVAGN